MPKSSDETKKTIDLIDVYIVAMLLFTILAAWELYGRYSDSQKLERALKRAPMHLAQMREWADEVKRTGLQSGAIAEPPTNDMFHQLNKDLRHRMGPKENKPISVKTVDSRELDGGWTENQFDVSWSSVTRKFLAQYIRDAEYNNPGLVATDIVLQGQPKVDPHFASYKVDKLVFRYYTPTVEEE